MGWVRGPGARGRGARLPSRDQAAAAALRYLWPTDLPRPAGRPRAAQVYTSPGEGPGDHMKPTRCVCPTGTHLAFPPPSPAGFRAGAVEIRILAFNTDSERSGCAAVRCWPGRVVPVTRERIEDTGTLT